MNMSRMYPSITVWGLLLLGACTGVKFSEPSLDLKVSYEDVPLSQFSSALRLNSDSSEADDYSAEELPKTQARDLNPNDYCYIVNMTGAGLPSLLRERRGSCENSFPGVGRVSRVFSWQEQANVIPQLGSMRFDLMGLKKSFFGSNCPKEVAFEEDAASGSIVLAGDRNTRTILTRGLETLAPVFLSKNQVTIVPGPNAVELALKRASSRPVGRLYGCQNFKFFPEANSDGILRTGMNKMFVKVDCPQDADRIRVETGYGQALSADASCDVRGQAFVHLVEPSSNDLLASEYDWYLPEYTVTALKGQNRIAVLPFKMKYSQKGRYGRLKDVSQRDDFLIPIGVNDTRFQLGNIDGGSVQVFIKNSLNTNVDSFEIPISQLPQVPMVWSGAPAIQSGLGAFDLGDPLNVIRSGFEATLNSGTLQVEKCALASCVGAFQGVQVARNPASVEKFDFALGSINPKLVSVGLEGGRLFSHVMRLNRQSWVNSGYGAGDEQVYDSNEGIFYPPWTNAEVHFVKALAYDASRDGIKSPFRENLVVGGSFISSGQGDRRSVIYRSPDGGKHWYRVYVGEAGSEMLDAKSVDLNYSFPGAVPIQPGFVMLERVRDLDLQGNSVDAGQLRVLVQDHHGF
jgi:hypothetical protein